MALADYNITFTDGTKTGFTIKPFTLNGPVNTIVSSCTTSPVVQPAPISGAVTSNTSLILPGKGSFEYGEIWGNNFVRLLEHFANPCEPAFAVEGQIWYKNDTQQLYVSITPTGVSFNDRWREIVVDGSIISDLDMGGYKIINLADATSPTDALNLQTADNRYVNVTGDLMSGFLTLSADPTLGLHAATKQYVDNAIIMGGGSFVLKSGDTMTGTLNMGGNFITNVANAVNPTDALNIQTATSLYVNATGGDSMSGIYNLSGTLNVSAGGVNLTFVPLTITASTLSLNSTNLTVLGAAILSFGLNRLTSVADPISPQDVATKNYVDTVVGGGGAVVINNRIMFVGNGAQTTFSFISTNVDPGFAYSYLTEAQKLNVFENGVKQYANTRGKSFIAVQGVPSLASSTGLTPATNYDFRITVDGGAPTMLTINMPVTTTWTDLESAISAQLLFAGLLARARAEYYPTLSIASIGIYSNATGSTSSVVIDDVGASNSLLTALSITADNTESVGTTYSYIESGAAFTNSTLIIFNTAPSLGAVIEIIIQK